MREEKKKKHQNSISKEPVPKVPERQKTGVLGTQTNYSKSLDEKYLADTDAFKKNALTINNKREAKGEGSIYSVLQPRRRPALSKLLGERIDVLYLFTQGKAKKKGTKIKLKGTTVGAREKLLRYTKIKQNQL